MAYADQGISVTRNITVSQSCKEPNDKIHANVTLEILGGAPVLWEWACPTGMLNTDEISICK